MQSASDRVHVTGSSIKIFVMAVIGHERPLSSVVARSVLIKITLPLKVVSATLPCFALDCIDAFNSNLPHPNHCVRVTAALLQSQLLNPIHVTFCSVSVLAPDSDFDLKPIQ